MPQVNVDVVRGLFRALAEEDFAAAVQLFHPDVEWRPTEGTYHGLEGVAAHLVEWLEPWEEHSLEAVRFSELGERVVAEVHITARGQSSGMEIDQRFFHLYTLEAGRIRRMDEYVTREEAVKAAGPAE